MKKVIVACVVALCLSGSSVLFAATTMPASVEADKAKKLEQVQVLYKGIIKKSKDGTALITEDKTYQLVGGDFSKMVGKAVNVVGKVAKEGKVEKLVVAKLEIQ